ncbi:MAG: hypothetical protein DM484_13025 [Candidatus Methylumidiphilus alinenensis]|uniref:Uncharacterized protein n=1 Tax=Candidatus Methylumidiphilus alinenensis TaxID=2202197 RepID=A0A2W4T697_9GAMM|nr:MAG: hypothetical protein DM484_13025 [Candidatus Methylumidiphilus alinenensis]
MQYAAAAIRVVGVVLQKLPSRFNLGWIFGHHGRVVALQFVQAHLAGHFLLIDFNPGRFAELQFRVGRFRCLDLGNHYVRLERRHLENRLRYQDGGYGRRRRRRQRNDRGRHCHLGIDACIHQTARVGRVRPQPMINHQRRHGAIVGQHQTEMIATAGRVIREPIDALMAHGGYDIGIHQGTRTRSD